MKLWRGYYFSAISGCLIMLFLTGLLNLGLFVFLETSHSLLLNLNKIKLIKIKTDMIERIQAINIVFAVYYYRVQINEKVA